MIENISPLDGRYADKTAELKPYFSEFALIRYRVMVEVAFLMALSAEPKITELPPFSDKTLDLLQKIVREFDPREAEEVKKIEKTTNHDVKAVEYYLKKKLTGSPMEAKLEFIHFACTSEDINNLAYALMLRNAMEEVMLPSMENLLVTVGQLAEKWKKTPLLSLTHGQPATPTTVGKELRVFEARLKRQFETLKKQEYPGKLNGATGNYSAHTASYPSVNWPAFSKAFVKGLGLTHNPLTTQIEPHDGQAECFDALARFNTILLGLNRDLWGYISRGVFKQKTLKGEVGSSTMPHKVNPIDFENSEGNLGLANALLNHLSAKLPVSRFQRDLTDSTVQRSIGTALGYALLAYKSALKGLGKLELDEAKVHAELDEQWALMAEPIQTVMRKNGIPNAYEKLKTMTRGKTVSEKTVRDFIRSLDLPSEDRERLLKLTPATYLGLADRL
jgi:adenylosuccinate lyase